MPNRATVTVTAEQLPPEMREKLRAVPGTRYRMTVEEIQETDDEKFAALRAHVARGLADLDAGRAHDHDDVFGELKASYPPI